MLKNLQLKGVDIIFPTSVINFEDTQESTQATNSDNSKCFKFDFETGQHIIIDGKFVECTYKEKIYQYIECLIRTEVNKYKVYTEDEEDTFGLSIYKQIGSRVLHNGFIIPELKRELEEQLTEQEEITEITNFTTSFNGRSLNLSFTVVLENGEILNYETVV